MPRPVHLCSLWSASKRMGRPLTVTEQKGELRNALHVRETVATVRLDSRPVMYVSMDLVRSNIRVDILLVAQVTCRSAYLLEIKEYSVMRCISCFMSIFSTSVPRPSPDPIYQLHLQRQNAAGAESRGLPRNPSIPERAPLLLDQKLVDSSNGLLGAQALSRKLRKMHFSKSFPMT